MCMYEFLHFTLFQSTVLYTTFDEVYKCMYIIIIIKTHSHVLSVLCMRLQSVYTIIMYYIYYMYMYVHIYMYMYMYVHILYSSSAYLYSSGLLADLEPCSARQH